MPTLTNNEKEKGTHGALFDTVANAKTKIWQNGDLVEADNQLYRFDVAQPLGADITDVAFNPTAGGTMLNINLFGIQLSTADATTLISANINPPLYFNTDDTAFKLVTPSGTTLNVGETPFSGIIGIIDNTAVTALVQSVDTPVEYDAVSINDDFMENFQLTTVAAAPNVRIQLECLLSESKQFYIQFSGTLKKVGGGTDNFFVRIYKNGVLIPNYQIDLGATTIVENFYFIVPTTCTSGDVFEAYMNNTGSSSSGQIMQAQFMVRKK